MLKLVLFLPGLLLFSAVVLKFLSLPWLWIFVACFAWAALGTAVVRNRMVRIILLNAALVLFILAAIEAVFWLVPTRKNKTGSRQVVQKGTIRDRYWRRHAVLGYAPITNLVATSTKYVGDRLLYDVVYTIDRNGLRITPPARDGRKAAAVLFFGCSFTFGEGVNDGETIPYQVALLSGGEYQVYNFGFHGYGPHQMLVAFEHGLVEQIVTNPVVCVVYQAIGGHVRRVTGPSPWDTHGPAYKLDRNGKAMYAGRFDDPKGRVQTWLEWQIEKSSVVKRFLTWQRPIMARDIRLFAAIIEKTRDLVESGYSGSEFHVIFWDENPAYEPIIRALEEKRIRLHRISRIIPDLKTNPGLYKIPVDDHPGPAAYRAIAEYVVNRVLDPLRGRKLTGSGESGRI